MQTKELCYYKPKTKHSFFDDNRQQVCGLLKNLFVFFGKSLQFFAHYSKKWSMIIRFYALFEIKHGSLGCGAILKVHKRARDFEIFENLCFLLLTLL